MKDTMNKLDFKDIKRGDYFWNSTQYANIKYIALTDGYDQDGDVFVVGKNVMNGGVSIFTPDVYGRTFLYDSPAYMGVPTNVPNDSAFAGLKGIRKL